MGLVMSSTKDFDGEVIACSITDPALFGDIYDRHAPAIAAYITRRVPSSDVEPLLSDIFVAAFEHRAQFNTESTSALPWLYGIARNTVSQHYRSAERERRATGRMANLVVVNATSARATDEIVEASTIGAARLEAARSFIDRQSATDRELLLLYAWDELTYDQISEALNIPLGTVKSKLSRLRQALRRSVRD